MTCWDSHFSHRLDTMAPRQCRQMPGTLPPGPRPRGWRAVGAGSHTGGLCACATETMAGWNPDGLQV